MSLLTAEKLNKLSYKDLKELAHSVNITKHYPSKEGYRQAILNLKKATHSSTNTVVLHPSPLPRRVANAVDSDELTLVLLDKTIPIETQPVELMYDFMKTLGKGGFGTVYLCREKFKPKKLVALKTINLNVGFKDASHEIKVLEPKIPGGRIIGGLAKILGIKPRVAKHPGLITIHRAFYGRSQIKGMIDTLYIQMEFIDGGSGNDLMLHIDSAPSEIKMKQELSQLAHMSYNLFCGMQKIHDRCVLHLDCKPANILWDKVSTPNRLVLADFGVSCYAENCRNNDAGTLYYQDPLIIKDRETTVFSDVYSLGVTLYEIATGQSFMNEQVGNLMKTKINDKKTQEALLVLYKKAQITINGLMKTFSYPPTSIEYIFFLTVILSCSPLDISLRPSLSTVIKAYDSNNVSILDHDTDEEIGLINGRCRK